MMLFQWVVFLLAMLAAGPFICRLTMLHPSLHRWPIILMHMSMAFSVAWGGYRGWVGDADFGDAASVVAPLLWIWVSYGNWSAGVPRHFRRPEKIRDPIDSSLLLRATHD